MTTTRRMPLTQQRRRITDGQAPGTTHQGKGWYFERRVSLDTIVGICGFALVIGAPLFYWARALESRVLTMEIHDTDRAKNDEKRDGEMRDFRKAVTDQFAQQGKQLTDLQITLGVLAGTRTAASTLTK